MNKETRLWISALMASIAITAAILILVEAAREPFTIGSLTQQVVATSVTTMPSACAGDGCPPYPDRDLIRAKSPLHSCAATMADIEIGIIVDVYNLDLGQMLDDGVVASAPYPETITPEMVAYAIDIEVDGHVGQRFLGDMGLIPYAPYGVWNNANFTVISGSCDKSLP